MIFERAWEIAKMGYAGMPLDETSAYYEAIRERLGLGEPFATGEQRRVFNIPGEPNFVAKVMNSEGKWGEPDQDEPYPFGTEQNTGFWEDYVYDTLSRLIPKTAERFLVPAEPMGFEENIGHVVRQPRVNVHPWDPQDPFNSKFHDTKARDWQQGFLDSARKEFPDIDSIHDLNEFIQEQDYGPGNFSDDMRLLDYYGIGIPAGYMGV